MDKLMDKLINDSIWNDIAFIILFVFGIRWYLKKLYDEDSLWYDIPILIALILYFYVFS